MCSQCEKSKRHCTGPDSPFRYQYGSAEQHAQLVQALDNVSVPEIGKSEMSDDLSWNKIIRPSETPSTPDSLTQVIPLTQSERLAATLVSVLNGPARYGQRLQDIGSHFCQLPVRLGRSAALDATVSCFMYSFSAVSAGQPRNQSLELARYCTAISALREEMTCSNPDGLLSAPSESLCASLLLAQYEVLKPQPAYSFIKISGGVSAIFKGCGPSRVTSSDFELAIFTSQYPTIVTQCLLRGEECFLGEPEWANVMRRSNGHESPMVSELWTALARIPRVLVHAKTLGHPPYSCASSPLCAKLLAQIYNIRAAIVSYSDVITRNLSTSGVYALYPLAYRGSHPVPAFHPQTKLESHQPKRTIKQATFYHACVIFINTILQNFLPTPNSALLLQTSQSAIYILDTLDFAITTKPFGSFYMTFAGPMCYGVLLDPIDKEILVQGMKNMFDQLGIFGSHSAMQEVFYAFTHGGWRRGIKVVLTEKKGRA